MVDEGNEILPILLEKGVITRQNAPQCTTQTEAARDTKVVAVTAFSDTTSKGKGNDHEGRAANENGATARASQSNAIYQGLAIEDSAVPATRASSQTTGPRRSQSQQQPGAYASAPVFMPSDPEIAQSSIVGAVAPATGDNRNPQSHEGLSVALPVDDSVVLPDAVPMDSSMADLDQRKGIQKRRIQSLGCFLALLCVAAAVIVVFTVPKKNKHRNDDQEEAVVTPTARATSEPSLSPSMAPTSLIEGLPYNTTLALSDPQSPQSKALTWLSNHPNITASSPEWRKKQLFALSTLFYSLRGEEWEEAIRESFMVYDKSECDWYSGVFAGYIYNFVEQKFKLYGRDTNDTTCTEDGIFTRANIDFPLPLDNGDPTIWGARKSGIPMEISLLSSLEEFSLRNFFTNWPVSEILIPELSQLSSLRVITLADVDATGTVPYSTITQLALDSFMISGYGHVTGTIPREFHNMSNVRRFQITSQNISGTIPDEIAQLSMLERLDLSSNPHLTGTLPSTIVGLARLQRLNIGFTHMAGSLSSDIIQLKNLTRLELQGAHFTGTLPPAFGGLTNLERLTLGENDFSGVIPSSLGLLTALTYLTANENRLMGTLPRSIGQLTRLTHLSLYDNNLSGMVPLEFWSLTALWQLNLSNNTGLQGTLPALQLSLFSSLRDLFLQNTSMQGALPLQALGNSSATATVVVLQGNAFSGTIASDVGLLTSLKWLSLAQNKLSGVIPVEMGNMT